MPQISYFFGILITMYCDDHNPPHFHAEYDGEEAVFDIQTLGMIKGTLPRRVRLMIVEWADIHNDELMANWHSLSQENASFTKIKGLD